MLGQVPKHEIYPVEQSNDKIGGGHVQLLRLLAGHLQHQGRACPCQVAPAIPAGTEAEMFSLQAAIDR